ncbi:MAG: sulfite exporter TauE/SafE family protein, partial [Archangium sp.]
MPSTTVIAVPLIFFLATLIRSTFGFGEALVSVPLLALLIPVKLAAPIAVLVSITVAAVVLLQDWREVHLRSAGWLVLSSALGIPLGLLLLKTAPEATVKLFLALVILAFSLYSLRSGPPRELKDDRLAGLFGFAAGVLGGAYGMNGPPLAIYGAMRRWSPAHFRATLQGYFLLASLAGMVSYWSAGLWTPALNRYYLLSLPAVLIAVPLGRAANRRLHVERFHRYLFAGLALIGLTLLSEAARS